MYQRCKDQGMHAKHFVYWKKHVSEYTKILQPPTNRCTILDDGHMSMLPDLDYKIWIKPYNFHVKYVFVQNVLFQHMLCCYWHPALLWCSLLSGVRVELGNVRLWKCLQLSMHMLYWCVPLIQMFQRINVHKCKCISLQIIM